MLGKVFSYYLHRYFSPAFSSSLPFGSPIMQMLLCLKLSQSSLDCLISFNSFFFILFHVSDFHQCLFPHFFIFLPHVLSYLFLLVIFYFGYCVVHLCCLTFKSSISLLNVSYNLQIFTSSFFPRPWINCTIITLKSFLCRLLISTSLSCYSGVLSGSFIWLIFLCLCILHNFLCGLLLAGYRRVASLAAGVCPPCR